VSESAAKIALTRLQRQVDEDRHPKTTITVRQALRQWLDVSELEDTTCERYDDLIRLYILPTLGDRLRASSTPSCWSASTPGCTDAASCARDGLVQGMCAGH